MATESEADTSAGQSDAAVRPAAGWLIAVALVVLAAALRPAVSSLGPVLSEVTKSFGFSTSTAGWLTTIPVLCFALIGGLAPGMAARFGGHRSVAVAVLAIVVGEFGRLLGSSGAVFLIATVVCLAGVAIGNVVLPAFVKRYFSGRSATLMTTGYTVAITAGAGIPPAVTVPIAHWLGGWRFGLGAWAVLAALALPPWIVLAVAETRNSRRTAGTVGGVDRHTATVRIADVARTRLGVIMLVGFGLQSAQAYAIFGWLAQRFRDAGLPASESGVLVAIVAGFGIPASLVIPALSGWRRDQRWLMTICWATGVVGYLGIWLAPTTATFVWVVLTGVSQSTFPLYLTMFGLRSRHADATGALSAFAQSGGYLVSMIGPLGVGWLYGLTDGWAGPMVLMLVLVCAMQVAGLYVAGNRVVDDQLTPGVRPADRG